MSKIKFYNEKRHKNFKPIDVKNLVNSRLKMQTTARKLEDNFGILAEDVFSETTLLKYKNFSDEKKEMFLRTIGGAFLNQTKKYIENLIK